MKISTIIFSETFKLLKNKKALYSSLFITLIWSFLLVPRVRDPNASLALLTNSTVYLATVIGFFVCIMFSNQIFFTEKKQKTIETLFCSPISLKQIWFGKTIAASIPSIIASYISVIIIYVGASLLQDKFILPSAELFGYLMFVVPLILISVIGLLGFIQLLFGMKEVRFLNMGFMMIIFFALGLVRSFSESKNFVVWTNVLIIFFIGVIFLLIVGYLTKFLNKERIITSIDDE